MVVFAPTHPAAGSSDQRPARCCAGIHEAISPDPRMTEKLVEKLVTDWSDLISIGYVSSVTRFSGPATLRICVINPGPADSNSFGRWLFHTQRFHGFNGSGPACRDESSAS
jgi:hypothetical protein